MNFLYCTDCGGFKIVSFSRCFCLMQVSVFLVPDRWKVSWQSPPPLFSLQRQESPSASFSLSLDPSYLSLSPVWLEFITRFIGGGGNRDRNYSPPSFSSVNAAAASGSVRQPCLERGEGGEATFSGRGEGDSEEKEGEAEGIFIGTEGPTDRGRVS